MQFSLFCFCFLSRSPPTNHKTHTHTNAEMELLESVKHAQQVEESMRTAGESRQLALLRLWMWLSSRVQSMGHYGSLCATRRTPRSAEAQARTLQADVARVGPLVVTSHTTAVNFHCSQLPLPIPTYTRTTSSFVCVRECLCEYASSSGMLFSCCISSNFLQLRQLDADWSTKLRDEQVPCCARVGGLLLPQFKIN
jgi:hypothetical protein